MRLLNIATMLLLMLSLAACQSTDNEGDIDPDFNRNDGSQPTNPDPTDPDPDPTDPDPTDPTDPPDPGTGGPGTEPTPGDPDPEPNEPDAPNVDLTYLKQWVYGCDEPDDFYHQHNRLNDTLSPFPADIEAAFVSGRNADNDALPDAWEYQIVFTYECARKQGLITESQKDTFIRDAASVAAQRYKEIFFTADSEVDLPLDYTSYDRGRKMFALELETINLLVTLLQTGEVKYPQNHSKRFRSAVIGFGHQCDNDDPEKNCLLDQASQSSPAPAGTDFEYVTGGNLKNRNVVFYVNARDAFIGQNEAQYFSEEIERRGISNGISSPSRPIIGGKITYKILQVNLDDADMGGVTQGFTAEEVRGFLSYWSSDLVLPPETMRAAMVSRIPTVLNSLSAEVLDGYVMQIEAALNGGAGSVVLMAHGWSSYVLNNIYNRLSTQFDSEQLSRVKLLYVAPLSRELAGDGNYCTAFNDNVVSFMRAVDSSIPAGNVSGEASLAPEVNHAFGSTYMSIDGPRECILDYFRRPSFLQVAANNPDMDDETDAFNAAFLSPDTLWAVGAEEPTVRMIIQTQEADGGFTTVRSDNLGDLSTGWLDYLPDQRAFYNLYRLPMAYNLAGNYIIKPDLTPGRTTITGGGNSAPSFFRIHRNHQSSLNQVTVMEPWRFNRDECLIRYDIYAITQSGKLYRHSDAREVKFSPYGYKVFVTFCDE